ncbi:hypothetical protein NP493_3g04024 [Ridgeia piscesae]|uniref:Uncharacterized protein n=1 Tax=Ridgeia piscesae TaxID=27915 RepID=A0AAD9PFU1_RIDPI|nr:hypothetical protein NP493_3g04024 [Ridgeia piscesae]
MTQKALNSRATLASSRNLSQTATQSHRRRLWTLSSHSLRMQQQQEKLPGRCAVESSQNASTQVERAQRRREWRF